MRAVFSYGITIEAHRPDFLARVMKKEALFVMDDPLARFNIMAYYGNEGLNWHFDRSEFTTILLLQSPLAGAGIQYRPNLRSFYLL